MLNTKAILKSGIFDHLGNQNTYSVNNENIPIETDFHWELTEDSRVTQSLRDEWEHMFKEISNLIPNVVENHLSIGGGGDSVMGSLLPSGTKTWVTINPNFLELTQLKNPQHLNTLLIRAIAEDIPIINNTFDNVDMLGTIDHLISPKLALKEIFRVSKPGAQVLITVTNSESWYKLFFKYLRIPIPNEHSHPHEFAPKQLKLMLEENGFQIQTIQTTYYLRLPILLEKIITGSKSRKVRHYISNTFLPIMLGRHKGGIIICLAKVPSL